MTAKLTAITISIMGKDYKIACAPEEQSDLLESARHLDTQMRKIRDTGKVNGPERIAVMAALNLAHELKTAENRNKQLERELVQGVLNMSKKIENVLENSETR